MEITHPYEGLGIEYHKTRKGTPKFAAFMINQSGYDSNDLIHPLNIIEFGIGSGQQTEFVEKELTTKGISKYRIIAFDKSYRSGADHAPGQFDILKDRIRNGEISSRVIPLQYDFDGVPLPLKSESIHLSYMSHVYHHLTNKKQLFNEINRITKKHGRHFIYGVTIEDLVNHPLDEFFPMKYEYDSKRYLTEENLKNLFQSAGFTFETPYKAGYDQAKPINGEFLRSIENTTIDSVLKMIKDADESGFNAGVQKVKEEVKNGEKSGKYRSYTSSITRIFWGIKK